MCPWLAVPRMPVPSQPRAARLLAAGRQGDRGCGEASQIDATCLTPTIASPASAWLRACPRPSQTRPPWTKSGSVDRRRACLRNPPGTGSPRSLAACTAAAEKGAPARERSFPSKPPRKPTRLSGGVPPSHSSKETGSSSSTTRYPPGTRLHREPRMAPELPTATAAPRRGAMGGSHAGLDRRPLPRAQEVVSRATPRKRKPRCGAASEALCRTRTGDPFLTMVVGKVAALWPGSQCACTQLQFAPCRSRQRRAGFGTLRYPVGTRRREPPDRASRPTRGRRRPGATAARSCQSRQSTAIANALQISRILTSASRPSRSTRTATETLSTESRLTAQR
jgi:hypothetical protein